MVRGQTERRPYPRGTTVGTDDAPGTDAGLTPKTERESLPFDRRDTRSGKVREVRVRGRCFA